MGLSSFGLLNIGYLYVQVQAKGYICKEAEQYIDAGVRTAAAEHVLESTARKQIHISEKVHPCAISHIAVL